MSEHVPDIAGDGFPPAVTYPGAVAREITLALRLPGMAEDSKVHLPVSVTAATSLPPPSDIIADFNPSEADLAVLEALEGKALKTPQLEAATVVFADQEVVLPQTW